MSVESGLTLSSPLACWIWFQNKVIKTNKSQNNLINQPQGLLGLNIFFKCSKISWELAIRATVRMAVILQLSGTLPFREAASLASL